MTADSSTRRRAATRLAALVFAILAAGGVVAAMLHAGVLTGTGPATPTHPLPTRPGAGTPTHQDHAEYRLATRPMLRLPPEAAQPQPLAQGRGAGPPITLPESRQNTGEGVPSGFDTSSRGALARLAAITEAGLRTGTPDGYAQVYERVSQPGAPPGDQSWQAIKLRSFYDSAELTPGDPANRIRMSFHPTHGLVKGTAHGGEYVVACVLGELTIEAGGRQTSVGLGDCQALRYTGRGWLIATGTPAYPAPSPWPGSADCVRAGFRELR